MVVTKGTKRYIKSGALKREIAHRPMRKKLKEQRTNKLNKAKEYDSNDKAQKAVEDDFKRQLEKLVKQKKTLPGEDQVDFSDFLKSRIDSDDDFEISDDEEGDLEFGASGEKAKKGKKKSKKSKAKSAEMGEDEEEGMEEAEEGEEDEFGEFGSEGEDFGSEDEFEGDDIDEDMIDTEGDEFEGKEDFGDDEEAAEEGEEPEEAEEAEDEDGRERKPRKKGKNALMEENLNKLLDDDEDLDEEVAAHKEELRSLQELDPSFFAYLAKEGKDVLDFDKLSKEMKEKKQTEAGGITTVNSKMLHEWITKAIEEDSLEDVKKILTAFQVSVMTEEEAIESVMPFRIEKEAVFNELVVFCLENLPDLFYDLMEEGGKKAKPASPTEVPTAKNVKLNSLPGFSKIKKLVYIYANVIFRLIEDSSDDVMLAFVTKNLVQFIPFVATSTAHTKKFLRSLLHIWATATKETRTSAYICIRQLTLYCPYPFINSVLRGIYLVYMQNCKRLNTAGALENINFMRNCVTEVYGLDFECSYQHMFTYMRQLAVTLQKALVAPTNESISQVYSWQYLNALGLWTDVLSKFPKQEHLQHLLYPLIQVIQGSITVDNHPKFYPYRIHLIRMLNSLASTNTSTFINSTPFSLDILGGPIMQTQFPYGNKNAFMDFKVMRKISEQAMRTRQFQEALINQVTELLTTNLATYAYSVSFPELSTFVTKICSSFLSRMGETPSTTHLSQLLTSLEKNALFIRKLREKGDKAPKDITNPLTTFFSPNLKNSEKAPLALFLAKFKKQVEKWETILSEKRVKLKSFDNYESDEEIAKDESESEEETTTQNGNSEPNGTTDEQKGNKKKNKKNAKKEEKEEAGVKEKKEKKRKAPTPQLSKINEFKEDVTTELVLSEDEEEEPKQKKVKTDKPKADKADKPKADKPKADKPKANKPTQNGGAKKPQNGGAKKPQNGEAKKPQNNSKPKLNKDKKKK